MIEDMWNILYKGLLWYFWRRIVTFQSFFIARLKKKKKLARNLSEMTTSLDFFLQGTLILCLTVSLNWHTDSNKKYSVSKRGLLN